MEISGLALQGGYLNLSACFIKNMSILTEKDKIMKLVALYMYRR
jgi:hypothetical protein